MDKALQPLELTLEKRPGEKLVEVFIPTEAVEIVSDFIVLNKKTDELKDIIKITSVK